MIKALALDNFWLPFPKYKNPTVSKGHSLGLRQFLALGLIAANLVLLMSYIYGVNEFASKGYEIKTLQTKLANLNDSNRQISLKVSEASSMLSIQSDFLGANFVLAGTPKFLEVNQFTQR